MPRPPRIDFPSVVGSVVRAVREAAEPVQAEPIAVVESLIEAARERLDVPRLPPEVRRRVTPRELGLAPGRRARMAVSATGPIGERWKATGGESGPLGRPVFPELDEGATRQQAFERGYIVHEPTLGTFVLSRPLFATWSARRAALGPPIGDATPFPSVPGAPQLLPCEHGHLVLVAGRGPHVVADPVLLRWLGHGGAGGWLGLPVADAEVVPGGRRQRFEHGEIVARGDFAVAMSAEFAAAWWARGGPEGPLRLPVADEADVGAGRTVRFEGGALFRAPGSGVVMLDSTWLGRWEADFGGPSGALGLPIGEVGTSTGGARWVDFEKGCLVLTPDDRWLPFGALQVWVERFVGIGNDGVAGDLDMYVHVAIVASTGESYAARLPSEGEYESDVTIARPFLDIPAARGGLTLQLVFDGWESDVGNLFGGDDDHFGRIDRTYTIDQLWGTTTPGAVREGNFQVDFGVRAPLKFDAARLRQEAFWTFQNFTIPDLSPSQFARTFADVDSDDEPLFHPLHVALYVLAYENVAENGTCFGMCLEAVYALLGRSMYAQPLAFRYGPPPNGETTYKPAHPNDTALLDQLGVRQGYQLGVENLRYMAGAIYAGITRDPVTTFALARELHRQGRWPMLGVYTDSYFGDGHIVLPYAFDDSTVPWKIKVANPNTPHPSHPDDHAWNIVTVDPRDGSWKLDQRNPDGSGTLYDGSGSLTAAGRIVVIPSDHLLQPPTSPDLPDLLAMIPLLVYMLAGGAETEQLTDEEGRTAFVAGLGERPSKWSHLRADAGAIPGLTPIPRFGAPFDPDRVRRHVERLRGVFERTAAPRYEQWVHRSPGARLVHRLRGTGGGPVRWAAFGERLGALVEYEPGVGEADEITLRRRTSVGTSVAFRPEGAREVSVTLGRPGALGASWRLRGLQVGAGVNVEATSFDGGRELRLAAEAPIAHLTLETWTGTAFAQRASPADLRLDASEILRVRSDLQSPTQLEAQVVDRGSAVVKRAFSL